ncbi:pyridoxal-phosphate dependent enzyme [Spongiivirga citrea]|uniref:Pyridoxal-phosphate dependent enzyme n=1 Tax=Spongiivirga citrea TaxID=1481457 RepID=A0A6M0CGM3_9FLAO|nr:pyridoxal-phosphate dependent enzyme [Spongiivirga citrea]NER16642.1 pyridoxal-phosphate dependent enzyme [Spongiivirga citrea]
MHSGKVIAAKKIISSHIHRTPILRSRLLNKIANSQLFFKCESLQKAGAYKIRGATNAILNLTTEEREKGVVTHSSGNFAQALSLAANLLGIPAYIVMPSNAPKVKKAGVIEYGGHIIECEPTLEAREATAAEIVQTKKATFIHPSNDIDVIYGQGTACLELLEDHTGVDIIVCPVGGGGLIAGSCLAVNDMNLNCTVIGAEPFEVDDAYRSLISKQIETNQTTNTIADGLKTQLGDKNFPIILDHVDSIIRVTEEEIVDAMKLFWQYTKVIIEPSSAVTLAAVLREKLVFQDKKVGIILSGGNVDLQNLPF